MAGGFMDIKVIFQDKSAGFVKDYLLEDELREGNVVAFKRAEGWVNVDYDGPDRRHKSPITTFFG
jgi:hypothetical protein